MFKEETGRKKIVACRHVKARGTLATATRSPKRGGHILGSTLGNAL
jgi:hypothetical protein